MNANSQPYTPEQTQQMIQIMSKHGQTGWLIEFYDPVSENWKHTNKPSWNWGDVIYRAVGPRKRIKLKTGMEIKFCRFITTFTGFALYEGLNGEWQFLLPDNKRFVSGFESGVTHYRWPNGDGTWLAIEGEPEIISL